MILNISNLIQKYNLKIEGVIHVGAHHGEEIDSYEQENIHNIICFEPTQSAFSVLYEKYNKKYDLFKIALGNYNKHISINLANNSQSSSILKPKIHLDQYPHITFDSTEIVQMMKLDDFMFTYEKNPDNIHKKFNFINIDVQGYELEVFKGSKQYLHKIDYINAEVNNDFVYEDCALVQELDQFLNQFKFERVETDWQGQTWGDAFYIKRS